LFAIGVKNRVCGNGYRKFQFIKKDRIMSLFKFIKEKCQCFFYPIKIGVCINLNKPKPSAYHFLGDKRSIENS